jgi:site-specific DNA recombinase
LSASITRSMWRCANRPDAKRDESQARDNTIASQVTALRERIAADGFQLEPDHNYVDEGYSGAILLRPALERLRDAVAGGHVERIYVHAPNRLARRYAHQVLLIDEFHRAGAEIVFLNRPIGGTAEDDLLLQVQGVIAEYEPKFWSAAGVAADMPHNPGLSVH